MKIKDPALACYFDPNTNQRVSHIVAVVEGEDGNDVLIERISGMELGVWSVVPVTEVLDDGTAKPDSKG